MTHDREPLHILILVAVVMVLLHLTIVPLAWAAAHLSDLFEDMHDRLSPAVARLRAA